MIHRIVLVLLVLSTVVSIQKSFDIDGFQYYFSDPVQKNWHEAVRHCNKIGMQLLDLVTEEEYIKVQKFMRDNVDKFPHSSYWISATSLGEIGEFYWIYSGDEIAENRTIVENENGFCLEINKELDFTFNAIECDYINYFICRQGKYVASLNYP